MTDRFAEAAAEAKRRRNEVLATLAMLRQRAAPAAIVDAALAKLDPQFTLLTRMKRRVARNKLLSLAVLAGAGWLAGLLRHLDGKPPAARKTGTASPRAKPKEKTNDSGQHHRHDGPGPGAGQGRKEQRSKGNPQAERRARSDRETRTAGGLAPVVVVS